MFVNNADIDVIEPAEDAWGHDPERQPQGLLQLLAVRRPPDAAAADRRIDHQQLLDRRRRRGVNQMTRTMAVEWATRRYVTGAILLVDGGYTAS